MRQLAKDKQATCEMADNTTADVVPTGAPPMDATKAAKAEKVFRSNLENQFEKVEEQARRLALIKQELETLEAPTRRDVAEVRARIDQTDRKFTKVRFKVSLMTLIIAH